MSQELEPILKRISTIETPYPRNQVVPGDGKTYAFKLVCQIVKIGYYEGWVGFVSWVERRFDSQVNVPPIR